MFRNINDMTDEELNLELNAIEQYEDIIDKVNVQGMLDEKYDLSFLKTLGCTITPNQQLFRIDKVGFLPEMLEGMYLDRKKFKKMMLAAKSEREKETDKDKLKEINKRIARYNNLQLAKKVGLNSAYGAMGSQYFRFFDIRLALAVTTSGQLSIRWIERDINLYMNNLLKTEKDYVIASDTDSIYLRMNELVEKVFNGKSDTNKIIEFMDKVCDDKIQPKIDESYNNLYIYTNAYAQKMQMKREVLADKGIWTAKKRYVLNVHNSEGVQYKEPHLKVMGLEVVKSSTPTIVRGMMKELIKLIVTGSEEEVQDYIANFRKVFKTLPPEDISFPRGVNGLKKYIDSTTIYKKGTPIHVKGSILYNEFIKSHELGSKYPAIQEGEKIKFTYLKQPNPLKSPVISYPNRLPPEFGLHEYIDYTTQFEKTFLDPITVILDCVNWRSEHMNTLDSFFS
ncbi:hypothetical protein M0R04_05205 [Candidatus Dojkabacteria bacterium]|jgi:DNA polymerase elongation subunit (family B)|nr:hypothetical protein [Candidatus Dojkabacteria bacterium]